MFIQVICNSISLNKMRNNPTINPMNVRKGAVGDWANYFSKEEEEEIEALYREKTTPDLRLFLESLE